MKPEDHQILSYGKVDELGPDDLEPGSLGIVVFGPGEGEAILVRFPDGSIGIVDGCSKTDKDGKGNPVASFLKQLQDRQKAPLAIRFLCMTHPHDDHFMGLDEIAEDYRENIDQIWTTPLLAELKEAGYDTILETILTNREKTPEKIYKNLLAVLNQFETFNERNQWKSLTVNSRLVEDQFSGVPFSAVGCAPADQDVRKAIKLIMSDRKPGRAPKGLGPYRDPNATSGAILVCWGGSRVLLSGDLLTHDAHIQGFKAAMDEGLFNDEIQVVKVSHHASDGAHDSHLWNQIKPILALVTPFRHGFTGRKSQPPRPESINRLAREAYVGDDGKSRGSVVVITNPLDWPAGGQNPLPMEKQGRECYLHPSKTRFKDKAKTLPYPKPQKNIHSAAAISMDHKGTILKLVMAGDADIYLHPSEIAPYK